MKWNSQHRKPPHGIRVLVWVKTFEDRRAKTVEQDQNIGLSSHPIAFAIWHEKIGDWQIDGCRGGFEVTHWAALHAPKGHTLIDNAEPI